MTRSLIIALFVLFGVLQYKLWFDADGIFNIYHLRQLIHQETKTNLAMKDQNALLKADVLSLKNGQEAIEERARHDLGMIKKGEVFISLEPKENEK